MSTALTVYGTETATSTLATACKLVTVTGGVSANQTTKVGTIQGSGELFSLGSTATFPGTAVSGSAGVHGFLWDVTTLEGQTFLPGTWTVKLNLNWNATYTTMTSTITARVWKRSSGGTFTKIGSDMTVAGPGASTTAQTLFTLTGSSFPIMAFATGDKLYLDVWLTVTSTGGATTRTIALWSSSSSSAGIAGQVEIDTPGYGTATTATKSTGVRTLVRTQQTATQPWYDRGYQYRKQIILDHTKVSGGADLTNFPVLISESSDVDLKTVANSGKVQNSNGYDIVFTDSTGTTQLDHEIEHYDPTTGEIEIWVRLPTLSASSDTILYLYYGNASVTSTQEHANSVWDANYLGIWHLNDNAATTTVKDSTTNANTGTAAANTSTKTTAGQIGSGLNFNGTSDIIKFAQSSVNTSTTVTVSAWASMTTAQIRDIFSTANPTAPLNGLYLYTGGSGGLRGEQDGGTEIISSGGVVTGGALHYVTMTWTGTTCTLYVDGTQTATGNGGSITASSNGFLIGAEFVTNATTFTAFWQGVIDEVRFSSVVRTAGWITTEYNNQKSPSSFYTIAASIAVTSLVPGLPVRTLVRTQVTKSVGLRTLLRTQHTMSTTLRALVRTQKTVSTAIRTLTRTQKTVSTAVRTLVRTQKTLTAGIRAVVKGITKVAGIRTNVRTLVTQSVPVRVRARTQKTLSTVLRVVTTASQLVTKSSVLRVLARTQQTRSTAVRTLVRTLQGVSAPLRTLLRTLQSRSAPLRTVVRTQINKSTALRTIVRGITKTVNLRANVRTQITKSVVLRTLIRTLMSVTTQLRTLVKTQINKSAPLRTLIRTRQTATSALRTRARTLNTQSTPIRTRIRTQISQSTVFRTIVRGITKITSLRVLVRTLKNLITPLRTVVRTQAAKSAVFRTLIRTTRTQSANLRTVIRTQVTKSATLRTLARTQKTVLLGVRTVVSTVGTIVTRSTALRTLIRTQKSVTSTLRARVGTQVSKSTTLRAGVRTIRSFSTPLRALVRTVHTASTRLRASVSTQTSRSLAVRADVRTEHHLTTGIRAPIRTLISRSASVRMLIRTVRNATTTLRLPVRTRNNKGATFRTKVRTGRTFSAMLRMPVRSRKATSASIRVVVAALVTSSIRPYTTSVTFRDGTTSATFRDGEAEVTFRDGLVQSGGR